MHPDVIDLRNFYYRTRLGRSVQRRLQTRLREFWPDIRNENLVAFGFTAPFLRPFRHEARRIINIMPASMGVMPWPSGELNISVLSRERAWPIAAGSVERLILAHVVETSDQPAILLEEAHRVLAPEGRALIILPNRSGAWARRDITPFVSGRPYLARQAEAVLKKAGFEIVESKGALFAPPSQRRQMLRLVPMIEWGLGGLDRRVMAGVHIFEVRKTQMRPVSGAKTRSRKITLPSLTPQQGDAQPSRYQK